MKIDEKTNAVALLTDTLLLANRWEGEEGQEGREGREGREG
jgi:hypothetical protein